MNNQNASNPAVEVQPCPVCNLPIGALAGSKDAICQNCGFKDSCCE